MDMDMNTDKVIDTDIYTEIVYVPLGLSDF